MGAFCGDGRLKRFAKHRNDPNVEAASHLSPYLNFGQLSCQRAALRVREERSKHAESVASYLEEQIVRRELSDNFCHYQPNYDSLAGARRGRATRWNCILLIRGNTFIVEKLWRRPRPPRTSGTRRSASSYARARARVHAHVLGEEDSGVD